jgi:hypothetical protein
MSSRTLYRLSGVTLIIGGLLLLISSIVGAILFPGHSSTPAQVLSLPWVLVTLLFLLGSLLCSIGLPAIYLRQSGQVGVMGFAGFILLWISFVLGVALSSVQVVALPLLAQTAPNLLVGHQIPLASAFLFVLLSSLTQLIGSILLGIATMRVAVFPRLAGVLLIVSGVLFLPLFLVNNTPPLSDILEVASFAALAGAFLWCGYFLMGREHRIREAAPFAQASAPTSRS